MSAQYTMTKTKIKTSTKAALAFLAVGGVVAGLVLITKNPAPTATKTPPKTAAATYACSDSDGGKDVFVQGKIYVQNTLDSTLVSSSKDYCLSATQVREYYCVSTSPDLFSSSPLNCEFGCLDGACLTAPAPSSPIPTSPGPTPTTTPTTSANLNITVVSDATTISRIYGPSLSGVQLGKWKFAAVGEDILLSKLTLQTVYANGSGVASTLGTFGPLSLYDGATLLATGSYVAGDVVFSGFSSVIPISSYKTYILKGNTNGSGVFTNNITTSFVVKSDSHIDITAKANTSGVFLDINNINYNLASSVGVAELGFAKATAYLFHDAYPVITSVSLGSALPVDYVNPVKIFKFTVNNPGTRDLRLASIITSVNVTGLVAPSAINDFRLYEDNGVGGLGTWLAQNNFSITASTSNPSNIAFNDSNDKNILLDNFYVSPGNTRTFIVTADTSHMHDNPFVSLTLSATIAGATGWSGTAWNTGNLLYYYTPVGGTEQGPFSASDSYPVVGSLLNGIAP